MGKTALVCGAGGFIGSHMVKRLKKEGYFVYAVDLKVPDFSSSPADWFFKGDIRKPEVWDMIMISMEFDELYQFAADMGGAGYLFQGNHDADVVHNSALINLYACEYAFKYKVKKVFFASSACVYPVENQEDPENPMCYEGSVYPANPDSDYGFEKLFGERLYLAYARDKGLNVRIGRFHGIFGPEGTFDGGKEKSVAAICRKVIKAREEVAVWGDGLQSRSYLYVDEAIEAVRRLMESHYALPVNIGSEEMVTINQLTKMICKIDEKVLSIKHIPGPQGVRGRNSNNSLIEKVLGWKPSMRLEEGLTKTYEWIKSQV